MNARLAINVTVLICQIATGFSVPNPTVDSRSGEELRWVKEHNEARVTYR